MRRKTRLSPSRPRYRPDHPGDDQLPDHGTAVGIVPVPYLARLGHGDPRRRDKLEDRSIDLRYQVLKEGKYVPALTIGLTDFTGRAGSRRNTWPRPRRLATG
jgi:hypothetical protein